MKSLRVKIVLILLSIFALYGIANYVIQRMIIFPGFIALEQDEARKDIARCVQALNREIYCASVQGFFPKGRVGQPPDFCAGAVRDDGGAMQVIRMNPRPHAVTVLGHSLALLS